MRNVGCTLAVLVGAFGSLFGPVTDAAAASARGISSGAPWRARRPATPPPATHQLLDPARWPAEPASPTEIAPERFRAAVAELCLKPVGKVPSDELLASAREADVDPFLLAALMRERSRCEQKRQSRGQYGLLGLSRALYDREGAPGPKIHSSEWRPANLLSARANLGLGARLLRMWQDEHDAIDLWFGGVPHRSPVSHFYWGDVVVSSGAEDLVLTARRRLIGIYAGSVVSPKPTDLGVALVPPLESMPRVATSGPGDDRDGGARRHRGLDVVASVGEPVRAIADGTVIFAGVNTGSNSRKGGIPPARIGRWARRPLGVGGIYLCIRHTAAAATSGRVVSCYMHLERYFVAQGAAVAAGETIGLVGRSGVRRSPPHLHFEVRVDNAFHDPLRYFADAMIPPRETLTHKWNERLRRSRQQAARLAAKRSAKILTGR